MTKSSFCQSMILCLGSWLYILSNDLNVYFITKECFEVMRITQKLKWLISLGLTNILKLLSENAKNCHNKKLAFSWSMITILIISLDLKTSNLVPQDNFFSRYLSMHECCSGGSRYYIIHLSNGLLQMEQPDASNCKESKFNGKIIHITIFTCIVNATLNITNGIVSIPLYANKSTQKRYLQRFRQQDSFKKYHLKRT